MLLTYKNEHGTIRLGGGGTRDAFRILEMHGNGFLDKQFTYNAYAGLPGHTLATETVASRVMTISGDVIKDHPAALPMSRVIKILNTDGVLTISCGSKVRRMPVRTLSFETEQVRAKIYRFVWQIEGDNPYFLGRAPVSFRIYKREHTLCSPFVLPCAFSSRTVRASVSNRGDCKAEPTLIIKKGAQDPVRQDMPVRITNETTGASIFLNHTIKPGETVTIDIPSRTIQSDVSGTLISSLSEDSVLASFTLTPGVNVISCETSDISLTLSLTFDELYLEAMDDA